MEPTYHTGQYLFIETDIGPDDLQYGVVVTFSKASYKSGMELIKRIIGVPGDKIFIVNGECYINGVKEALEFENIIYYENTSYNLRDDEYFVLGDNRSNSIDSRFFGPIHYEDIFGIVKEKQLFK